MYICLCQAVTDHDIEAAVRAGAHTMHEVQQSLAVSTGCGTCASAAQMVIDQTLQKLLSQPTMQILPVCDYKICPRATSTPLSMLPNNTPTQH